MEGIHWRGPKSSIRSAAIAINDKTRPVPQGDLLPPLLARLLGLGLAPDAVTLLIATGSHPPMNPEEFGQVVPLEILRRHLVVCHDAEDRESLVYLGSTGRGTPVRINRRFAQADLRIARRQHRTPPVHGLLWRRQDGRRRPGGQRDHQSQPRADGRPPVEAGQVRGQPGPAGCRGNRSHDRRAFRPQCHPERRQADRRCCRRRAGRRHTEGHPAGAEALRGSRGCTLRPRHCIPGRPSQGSQPLPGAEGAGPRRARHPRWGNGDPGRSLPGKVRGARTTSSG